MCLCVFCALYWFSAFLCYVSSSVWASFAWNKTMEWNGKHSIRCQSNCILNTIDQHIKYWSQPASKPSNPFVVVNQNQFHDWNRFWQMDYIISRKIKGTNKNAQNVSIKFPTKQSSHSADFNVQTNRKHNKIIGLLANRVSSFKFAISNATLVTLLLVLSCRVEGSLQLSLSSESSFMRFS